MAMMEAYTTSINGGSSWTFLENLPITQFYTCDADEQNPQRLYVGTQDNGTNRTLTGNTGDWQNIYWGDGFFVLVDPTDNNYIYAEYQYGNFARSTNGEHFSQKWYQGSTMNRTHFIIDPITLKPFITAQTGCTNDQPRNTWCFVLIHKRRWCSEVVYGMITTRYVAPSNNHHYVELMMEMMATQMEVIDSYFNGLPSMDYAIAVDPGNEQTAWVTPGISL
jgi:hypothetical protein